MILQVGGRRKSINKALVCGADTYCATSVELKYRKYVVVFGTSLVVVVKDVVVFTSTQTFGYFKQTSHLHSSGNHHLHR